MFVPSESVYAEIHDGFDDVIQKAYRARVVLVSPSLLMLAIQVMQQILKDARMRDAADQIRTEVLQPRRRSRPPARPRAEAAKALWRRQRGRPANPDLRRQDRKARRTDRGARFQQDRGAGGSPAHRQASAAPELFPAAAEAAGGGVASSLLPLRGMGTRRITAGLSKMRPAAESKFSRNSWRFRWKGDNSIQSLSRARQGNPRQCRQTNMFRIVSLISPLEC